MFMHPITPDGRKGNSHTQGLEILFLGWIVQLGWHGVGRRRASLFLNVKHTWWFGIRIEIEEAFHISSHSGRSRVSFAN